MAAKNRWKNVCMTVMVMLLITMSLNQILDVQDDQLLPAKEINIGHGDLGSKDIEMKERILRMRESCSQYPHRRQLRANLSGKRLFYISEKQKLSYCRVAKVGSTFWTQVFMTLAGINIQLDEEGEVKSMFDLPRDKVHREMKKLKDLTTNLQDPRIPSTTSFLVARNPYARLFSSYIDQIYLPNKWELAKGMVKDSNRKECGDDVTFDEFLSAISERMVKGQVLDLHWAPIFSICLPCDTKVDILAKQESFNEDADYILKQVGVDKSIRDEVASSVGENLIETTIPTLVHTYVSKGHHTKHGCITQDKLAEKIWSAFQIQGHIHNDTPFPAETFTDVPNADLESVLTNAVLKAIEAIPLGTAERAIQRQEWKMKFWKEISSETLQKVQDAFYEDFFVFQYDVDPNAM